MLATGILLIEYNGLGVEMLIDGEAGVILLSKNQIITVGVGLRRRLPTWLQILILSR